ncbi:MAG TPA: hypothetical protein VKF32_14765 [Thermoanaerobaculia bacterium]|nr:hypothetical protein [Thermoanaerobaculia bacterium]
MQEAPNLNQAYTRLSEKFKTLWTFHQFLQGLHKTFLGSAPAYTIDFQGLYEEIKGLAVAMAFQPAAVAETIQRVDGQLDGIHRTLADDDGAVPPSFVRRFLEKVKTEEEKLLVSLLRFYFASKTLQHDAVDKVDFLVTLVGARRSLDDGHYIVRFPVELQKLFGGLIALAPRSEPPRELVTGLVEGFGRMKRQIEGCANFEDLVESKVLDNLRRLKHNMGSAFYTVEALSAMLEANLAAKNKFSSLYEAEERRILDSSRRLQRAEKELESGGWQRDDLAGEFRKLHELKTDIEAKSRERGVRRQEVRRLSQSIETLLARLDLPGEPAAGSAADASVGLATRPADSASYTPSPPTNTSRGLGAHPPRETGKPRLREGATAPEKDPLTADVASKVLSSVDPDGPSGTGARGFARFRLEPWEVSAARRILSGAVSGDSDRARDLLFFESALVRIRIDEEAQQLRGNDAPAGANGAIASRLASAGLCLTRAQDLDRRFRGEMESVAREASPDRMKEVNRSRFRLLRSFAGLWLLHDSKS